MAKLTDMYTSDSLQSYQTAYKDYMSQGMSSNDALNKAKGLLVEKGNSGGTATTPTNNSTYQNQGAGNYVYNEKTGYYENQTDKTNNTVNQDFNKTTEVIKQEAPTKQEETVVKTDNEIKQEGKLAPLSKEYYSQTSDEAQNTIRNNLNGYRQTNPELFSSYEEFKKNFSYDARDDIQKQTLDNWYKGYEKGLQLSNIPTTDLYTQYKDGTVSLSDLETLRVYNPEKYAELQNQINKGNIIQAYDDDKGEEAGQKSIQEMAYDYLAQTFNSFMNGDSSSGASQFFRDYEAKMNDPEMLGLSDKCTEVQEQMENIQTDIDSMKKSVEAEYEGTGASRAKINAIIADRTYDLQLQLRTLNSEYNKYATQYNNRMNQYQTEFKMQLQEYQLAQDERNQQMKELGFAMDLMNFETNEQKQQREWDYWVKQQEYTNGNINSKDYDTRYKAALKSVQNLLSQYEGIPMVRSAEQMAQDVLTAIDNGSNLGAELTKINQQIQQKPEYKYLYNNTYGKGNDIKYETFKLGDKEYIVYNNELMSSDEFNKKYGGKATGATGDAKPYDIVSESVFDVGDGYQTKAGTLGAFLSDPKNATKNNGGWCGAFVNKYLKSIGVTNENYYDNELSTKLNSVNTKVPKVGSVAVFDFGHITAETGQNHGHVGIVTKVYSDGSFDVIESNYNSDKKIGTRQHINPQSSSVKGFFDPSQPPAGTSNTSASSKDAFTAAGNNIALNLGSVSATNTFNEQLQNYLDKGDYTRAFEYITTQARNKADSDTKQAINSAESAISALVSIQHGLDAFYEAGGDTGIFAGTAEQVANKIGKTTDPKLKQLATQINVAIQKYRQAISGAAFSEQEAAEYASIFPSTKNDKELNTALIDGTLQTMLQNLTSSYAQILGTSTYTDLLQAYQNSTGDIYNYYGNKDTLTKYLENNGYLKTADNAIMLSNIGNNTNDARYTSVMSDYSNNIINNNVVNVGGYDFPSTF